MRTVLIIGDMHLPWACTKTVTQVYSAIERHKPRIIIQMGDLYDMFSFTRFAKRFIITPERELEEAREYAENFWKNCQKRAPLSKRFQLLGNHDIRPKLRALEKNPEMMCLMQKGWEDLFKFVGVETIWDPRDDLEIDGVVYEHGFYGRPGQHMKENMRRTVIGHTHRAWLHYEKIRKDLLWELNVGYVADPTQEPLSYPRKKWIKWTKGYGLVDNEGPRFIPFLG